MPTGGTLMSDTNRYAELLEQERTRLHDIRSSLTEVAEDVERDQTGDPSAGGHLADAGSDAERVSTGSRSGEGYPRGHRSRRCVMPDERPSVKNEDLYEAQKENV
jgi:hypothetical protein